MSDQGDVGEMERVGGCFPGRRVLLTRERAAAIRRAMDEARVLSVEDLGTDGYADEAAELALRRAVDELGVGMTPWLFDEIEAHYADEPDADPVELCNGFRFGEDGLISETFHMVWFPGVGRGTVWVDDPNNAWTDCEGLDELADRYNDYENRWAN